MCIHKYTQAIPDLWRLSWTHSFAIQNGSFLSSSEAPEEAYDPRSLFERLQEQKDKKQEEFEEQFKFSKLLFVRELFWVKTLTFRKGSWSVAEFHMNSMLCD